MTNDTSQKHLSLEEQMVSYQDLLPIPVIDNGEFFIALDPHSIPNEYVSSMNDMIVITGDRVLVRESVYTKLKQAQKTLKDTYPTLTLFVTYGYRSLEVQTKKFLEQLHITDTTYFPNPIDLYEEVHRFIAVPTVAGHPTGGAIDILIKNEATNTSLDFGSEQYNYETKDCYVFADHISQEAKDHRMLLRNTLMECGFAPFDGEWWHFSYGDREWAKYYKRESAIFSQVLSTDIRVLEKA